MEESLRRLTKDLQLEASIIFETVVHQTPEILPIFDVSVTPSLDEGFGISVIEAQAAGLPVVGSRVGGIPSLIRHEETGLLVESNNVDELADAIIRLLKDRALADRLGAAAREFVLKYFSADLTVEKTEQVYQSVISGTL